MFLGSDAIALAPFTNSITYLEDGDWAVVRRNEVADLRHGRQAGRAQAPAVARHQLHGRQGQPPPFHGEGNPRAAGGDLAHAGALSRLHRAARRSRSTCRSISPRLDRLAISACGTAYLAGLIGKYWFERYARLPVDIDVASEFRYREMPISKHERRASSSRSRARPPTRWRRCAIAARPACRSAPSSTSANRRSRANPTSTLPTLAGPEIGVASTKAFTCQLSVLASLAVRAGVRARHDFARTRKRRWCAASPKRRAMPARC